MNPLNRPQIHLGITTAFQVLILISLLAILTTPSISHAAFPGTNGKDCLLGSTRDGSFEQIYVMNADGTAYVTRVNLYGGA